jgi:L-rhamnose isomerase
LLEPTDRLREYEENGQYFERLALLELLRTKPFGAVYDYYCLVNDVPVGEDYINVIEDYEKEVLSKRS